MVFDQSRNVSKWGKRILLASHGLVVLPVSDFIPVPGPFPPLWLPIAPRDKELPLRSQIIISTERHLQIKVHVVHIG